MAEDTPSTQRSLNTEAENGAGSAPHYAVAQPRVALIGRAGAGKTALAQALFGTQNTPTATGDIARYQDDTTPIIVDDLPGWVNGSESSLSTLFSYVENARSADTPLVAVWYALDAVSARVTDYERQLIRRLAQISPVVIVLTRADLVSPEALAAMQSAVEEAAIPNVLGIVAVAADPLPALGVAPYGVDEVMALTPERAQQPRYDLPDHPEVATKRMEQPADQMEARPVTNQSRLGQPPSGAQRAARRDERANYGEVYGSATGVRSSGALIALLVVASLVLALLLLGRRHRHATGS